MTTSLRSRRLRRRILPLGALAGVVLCGSLAAPLFAFASRTSHSVLLAPNQVGSAKATCPHGEHVQFGGFVTKPRSSEVVKYSIATGMHRTSDGKWTVDGVGGLLDGPLYNVRSAPLTSVAYCGRGAVASKVTNTAKVSNYIGTAIARCPAGQVVVAGGFATHTWGNKPIGISDLERIAPDEWRVTVSDFAFGPSTVTAIAYCGAGPAPTRVWKTISIAHFHGGTAHVACPSGTSLLFGGAFAEPIQDPNSLRQLVMPFRLTADNKTTWSVAGQSNGWLPGDLTAFAYCR